MLEGPAGARAGRETLGVPPELRGWWGVGVVHGGGGGGAPGSEARWLHHENELRNVYARYAVVCVKCVWCVRGV